jgi:hypothetical protein
MSDVMVSDEPNTGGIQLDIGAGLKLAFGQLTDELREQRQLALDSKPIDYRNSAVGAFPSSGNLGLDLGGPALGRLWLVRRVIVAGLTWGTTAAGTAEVYVGGTTPQLAASSRDITMLTDESAALPNKAFYSNRQMPVQHGERVIAVVIGGTSTQQYVATIQAEDYSVAGLHGAAYEL